jgi:FkbM family methyltransferase
VTATVELRTPFDGRTFTVAGSEADASIMAAIRDGGGQYEPEVMLVLSRLVERDWVCLDVGANLGAIALVLAHLCPDGRVHAFEAAGENVAHLAANLAANGATNATAHHLALYDRDETLTLHFTSSYAGGSFVSDVVDEGQAEDVPARRLDGWAAEHGIDRLDLVKLDVEGAEARMLAGAAATIERFRPHLVVEFNPIVSQRFQRQPPGALWDVLARLYPHRFAIGPGGRLTRLLSWAHLRALLHERAVIDLLCTFAGGRRLGRLDLPGRAAAARSFAAAAAAANPWRPSRGSFVPEPRSEVVAGVDRLRLVAGEAVTVQAWVRNASDSWLSSEVAPYPVRLGCRWFQGGRLAAEGHRVPFGALRPGASTRVALPVTAPERPGRYRLAVSPIQDGIAWFDDLDPANGTAVDVEVEPAPGS